jgi:hypothetical protein
MIQALTFMTPWALAGLILLPVIWWLLRFTPPKPQTVKFPPLRLLLELVTREEQPDTTPWWLMLLRLALAALVILGVAHPLYAPGRDAGGSRDPLLIVVDDSWAAAPQWQTRRDILRELIDGAARDNAAVAIAGTVAQARPAILAPQAAETARGQALALEAKALPPDRPGAFERLKQAFGAAENLRIVWLSDGLDDGAAKSFAEGLLTLANGRAQVQAIVPERSDIPAALASPTIDGGRIKLTALRVPQAGVQDLNLQALAGNGRNLATSKLTFAANAGKAEAVLDLPIELRNEAQRIEFEGRSSAAGVFLLDDRWRRKTVALQTGTSLEFDQPLLSPLYYVSRALEPYTEISRPADEKALQERLDAGLSMLVLADIGKLPGAEHDSILSWIDKGGVLVRFAGPRLAGGQDDLTPVTLREGDRSFGKDLSWETPQALQPFPDASHFSGVSLDPAIRVNRQVLAEPDADLPGKVWASLTDGTPLVTAKHQGKGLIVLFHVTANADWSNLPISGMFVEMLRRVLDLAPGAGGGAAPGAHSAEDVAAAFTPRRVLNGAGDLVDPQPEAAPIAPADMDKAKPSPQHPAGLYTRGAIERALNLTVAGDALQPIAGLPAAIAVRSLAPQPAVALAPYLFALAMVLFLLDCCASLLLNGGWRRLHLRNAAAGLAVLTVLPFFPQGGWAQSLSPADEFALKNTQQTHLAYVLTGNSEADDVSRAGLMGLDNILVARTSVEPGDPVGIDLDKDEIVFFPLLYWPVLADAEAPSPTAIARLSAFMKNGGTVFFDTRDDGNDLNVMTGSPSPTVLALRRILEKLDIPALEPVPPDHVLTKAFYLLQDFPGRYAAGRLWVEASNSQGASSGNGDGVSAIIIGANDYAAAWAMDSNGNPLYAAVPGGDRQRELAYRSGVNIVMYALTGNYKADQVHIPALLERLGQ